jgi:hypothetical protein
MDKWAGRFKQILKDARTTQVMDELVPSMIGQWEVICCTDTRWGISARGQGNERKLERDPLIALTKNLATKGIRVPFPSDAPMCLLTGDF